MGERGEGALVDAGGGEGGGGAGGGGGRCARRVGSWTNPDPRPVGVTVISDTPTSVIHYQVAQKKERKKRV